jgi:hypothetical protein
LADYLGDFTISASGLTLSQLNIRVRTRTEYTPDARYVEAAAAGPSKVVLEGTVTLASLVLARAWAEAIRGLYRLRETLFLRGSVGSMFVTLDVLDEEVDGTSFEIRICLVMGYVGTTSTHVRGYGLADVETVTSSWGI